MHLVILSAGQGTRIGEDTPKCMITVGSKTLLERNFDAAHFVGIKDIRVVIGKGGIWTPQRQANVKQKVAGFGGCTIVNERSLETHSVASLSAAFHDFDDDLLVIDGDVIYEKNVFLKLADKNITTVVVNMAEKKTGGSRVLLSENKIHNELYVKEISENIKSDYVYAGMMKICKEDMGVYGEKLKDEFYDNKIIAEPMNDIYKVKKSACLLADCGNNEYSDYANNVVDGKVVNINTKADLSQVREVALKI